MAKYTTEFCAEMFRAIIRQFGGQEVQNTVLKAWLCQTFPEHFSRADYFLEYIAKVDFASNYKRDPVTGEYIIPDGFYLLPGTKPNGRRIWHPPTHWDGSMPLKRDQLRIVAPLPTKQRKTIRFGDYVAAKKADTTVE